MKIVSCITVEYDDKTIVSYHFEEANKTVKQGIEFDKPPLKVIKNIQAKLAKAFDLLVKTEELSEIKSKEVQTT